MSLILDVKDLSIGISKPKLTLTEGVSFQIAEGEILALVGESGSGKSISALACCGLYPEPNGYHLSGQIEFNGIDCTHYNDSDWNQLRGNEISMIFQEPGSALNPLMNIQAQMMEYFSIHQPDNKEAFQECKSLLEQVGLEPHRVLKSFPHQLSGGMQQRVMIAMALLLKPKLLIADEPTTALDVTVQAQIMDLLLSIQEERNFSILFITHNLALVAQYCDRLVVMQDGQVVESDEVVQFIQAPKTQYGRKLLDAVPRL